MAANNECDTPPPEHPVLDYVAVEARYLQVFSELEGNIAMEEFLAEFQALHDALNIAKRTEELYKDECNALREQIVANQTSVEQATEAAKEAQNSVKEMKEAMESAFRRLDAAHAREQHAQEALVEAERQAAQLRHDMEQNSRAALESDEFGGLPRSQDEQRQDRERLTREANELRSKLVNAATAYDELEKKNMAAGAKLDTMAQHLEILSAELSKEIRQREALENEQHTHSHILSTKEEQVTSLEDQLRGVQRVVLRLEQGERDSKATVERLMRELETAGVRAQRAQQDYEAELVRVERLTREAGQKGAAFKAREEEIGRARQDALRSVKTQELHMKRLAAAEAARADVERERDELRSLVIEREREAERHRKQAEAFKKRLDEICREKDLQSKNLTKVAALTSQQVERAKQQEQTERALRAQLEQRDEQIAQHKMIAKKFEREAEKLRSENTRKVAHSECVCEQLRNKHEEAVRARRDALEVNFRHQHEVALFEAVRTDKEAAERQLVSLKAQVERLQEKLRDVEHKSSQLKSSISAHESLSMKNELTLQRAEREKESARHELRQAREHLSTFRDRVTAAENEQRRLHELLNESIKTRNIQDATIAKLGENQSEIQKQLRIQTEEMSTLYSQIKALECKSQRQEMNYDQKVDDIRLLKIEIRNSRQEKAALSLNLNNMADARQQIFRLHRDLTAEQLKCKALEEEMTRPRNVHRWRFLQGEDPERLELVQRLAFTQRRLVTQSANPIEKDQRQQKQDKQNQEPTENSPRELPSPQLLHQLRQKNKHIKALLAERSMLQCEVASLRNEIHTLGQQLQDVKRKLFTQKRRLQVERARQQKAAETVMSANGSSVCTIVLQPAPSNGINNKARFTGGGFNLNVTPQDSRLLSTP